MGAGNPTQNLWKNGQCSEPLSHLPSPLPNQCFKKPNPSMSTGKRRSQRDANEERVARSQIYSTLSEDKMAPAEVCCVSCLPCKTFSGPTPRTNKKKSKGRGRQRRGRKKQGREGGRDETVGANCLWAQ